RARPAAALLALAALRAGRAHAAGSPALLRMRRSARRSCAGRGAAMGGRDRGRAVGLQGAGRVARRSRQQGSPAGRRARILAHMRPSWTFPLAWTGYSAQRLIGGFGRFSSFAGQAARSGREVGTWAEHVVAQMA